MRSIGTGAELASLRNQLLHPGSKSSAAFLIRPLHRLESFFFFPQRRRKFTGVGGGGWIWDGGGVTEANLWRAQIGAHQFINLQRFRGNSPPTGRRSAPERRGCSEGLRLGGKVQHRGGGEGSSHSQEPKTSRLAERCCSRGNVRFPRRSAPFRASKPCFRKYQSKPSGFVAAGQPQAGVSMAIVVHGNRPPQAGALGPSVSDAPTPTRRH